MECLYCSKCGGFIEYERGARLLSSPAKYSGECRDCGHERYAACHEVDHALDSLKTSSRSLDKET